MKRNLMVMLVLGLLSLGSLAIAGDTTSAASDCPQGCCTSCGGCGGGSCGLTP